MRPLKLLLFFCVLTTALFSQDKTEAFGKAGSADLLMTKCAFEPNAEAMVLFRNGTFTGYINENAYVQENLVTSEFEEHVRIKILSEKGLERANIKIRYRAGNGMEDIRNLSAHTINADQSGNAVITKVESNQVFTYKINNRYTEISFVFPQVKVGSIIEYKYKKVSKNLYALDTWFMQESIPARYNSYTLNYPSVLDIRMNTSKAVGVKKKESPPDSRIVQTYFLENVRALPDEIFMTSREDYLMRLNPIVYSVTNSTGERFDLLKTWPQVIRQLLEDEDFGLQLKKNIPRTAELDALLVGVDDPFKRMSIVYYYVRKHMLWDGSKSLWALNGVKSAWKDKKGNAGEINLILVNLLKDAGLVANPVLVSTKNNGRVETDVASIGQFDKVMAYITIGDNFYVLDATNSNAPVNIIPQDVMYSEGLLVGKGDKGEEWGWKYLWNKDQQFAEEIYLFAGIDEKGLIKGQGTITSHDYARIFKSIRVKEKKDELKKEMEADNKGYSIDSVEYNNEAIDSLALVQNFLYEGNVVTSGNYAHFSINQFTGFEKNRFIANERFSDIFFGATQQYRITAFYTLPKNFTIEDMPKNVRMIMPDTSIIFSRFSSFSDNQLNVSVHIDFKNTFYTAADYPYFYEFYKKMFAYLNEQFVMKKK